MELGSNVVGIPMPKSVASSPHKEGSILMTASPTKHVILKIVQGDMDLLNGLTGKDMTIE